MLSVLSITESASIQDSVTVADLLVLVREYETVMLDFLLPRRLEMQKIIHAIRFCINRYVFFPMFLQNLRLTLC